MEHNHHHNSQSLSEVTTKISYQAGEVLIELNDKHGEIPTLNSTHEKMMHLIIIRSDLADYYHLHPIAKSPGEFVQQIQLPDGEYVVFVDINPQDLAYAIKPIHLTVGNKVEDSHKNKLIADTNFTKTFNGQTVVLHADPIKKDKEAVFRFEIKDATPEPYLGALGHVVITDEKVEEFIHVHPMSPDKTTFMTEFNDSGLYKMWAEFKINGEVIAYPFVIEVE